MAVIGGGAMARALLAGVSRAPSERAAAAELGGFRFAVAEPDAEKRAGLAGLAEAVVPDAAGALRWLDETEDAPGAGQVLLAVKPQALGLVGAELRARLTAQRRVVISVLAGTPAARVGSALGGNVGVVRAMPNLAAEVGAAVTAIALGPGAKERDADLALELFSAVGPLVLRTTEAELDALTAVAASGPAYAFYLAAAMEEAARRLGLGRDAAAVVAQTLAGAAALLARGPEGPGALIGRVASTGGTTAAALRELDGAGVGAAITRAVLAAHARAREMSEGPGTEPRDGGAKEGGSRSAREPGQGGPQTERASENRPPGLERGK